MLTREATVAKGPVGVVGVRRRPDRHLLPLDGLFVDPELPAAVVPVPEDTYPDCAAALECRLPEVMTSWTKMD